MADFELVSTYPRFVATEDNNAEQTLEQAGPKSGCGLRCSGGSGCR